MDWICVDIETAPHASAAEFVTRPDLETIQPAANLKDPVKVAESIAQRKAAAQADYETSLSRCGLDFNLNRIVALAAQDSHGTTYTGVARDEDEEAELIAGFWRKKGYRAIAGFAARSFDVPVLIQRSRLLGIKHPHVNLARYGRGDVIDLRDILTFDDARYEAIMPRSLKAFAKRFGIHVDDAVNGADIASLVAAGDWVSISNHVCSDVDLTVQLGQRIGVLSLPLVAASDARRGTP